jgi:pyrroloquinoline quinone (PQQ) biosynthesis protein C
MSGWEIYCEDVSRMFPTSIDLLPLHEPDEGFWKAWNAMMQEECHAHTIWSGEFVRTLESANAKAEKAFHLAAVWSLNMVAGSYCFPRYVAALAGRAESDSVRHGLLENAWDESGGVNHAARSHFWLAVRLARLLGADDTQLKNVIPIDAARGYTDEHYRMCAEGDFGEALGMICLIEEFTTPEFSLILRAFVSTWPKAKGQTIDEFLLRGGAEYFTANIADDERHRNEMPRIVATLLRNEKIDLNSRAGIEKGLEPIRRGIQRSIASRATFFDGIVKYVDERGTFEALLAGPGQVKR